MRFEKNCHRKLRIIGAAVLATLGASQSVHAVPQVQTVFVIAMENHNFIQPGTQTSPQQVYGNPAAPYETSLVTPGNPNAAQASWAKNYFSVGASIHPSEPNYIWAEAGKDFGVSARPGADNDPFAPNTNGRITNQDTNYHLTGFLQSAGVPWKTYQEDAQINYTNNTVLPQSQWTVPQSSKRGVFTTGTNAWNGSNQYDLAPKHDPMVFFTDTNGGNNANYADPTTNPLASKYAPLQQLSTDLANNTVARYNFITPNQFNDQHSGLTGGYKGLTGDAANIKQGDDFLAAIVPQIMASQAYQNNGAIVIWNDETEGGDDANHTSMEIVLSPLAKGNAYVNNAASYTHSSDLRTMQEIFNVGSNNPAATGGVFLNDANNVADLSDLFVAGAIPGTPTNLVPEPASLGLLGVGVISVLARRKRKA